MCRLVRRGRGGGRISIAVVPLPSRGGAAHRIVLMPGKRDICAPLSVPYFARSHQLTQAETLVLECLCSSAASREIARTLAVQLCAAHTHISAVRSKTGTPG